eukprot:GHVL01021863.1.p1 GENE.GHVL01021863.1~~GHVL01021863.1.p1  ORF type:complete len:264 (-),score=77.22 GHVL01021863.1:231-1022(-)
MGNSNNTNKNNFIFLKNKHNGPISSVFFKEDYLVSTGGNCFSIQRENSLIHQMTFPDEIGEAIILENLFVVASRGGLIWIGDTRNWTFIECFDLIEEMFCPRISLIESTGQLLVGAPNHLYICNFRIDHSADIINISFCSNIYFRCICVYNNIYAIGYDYGIIKIYSLINYNILYYFNIKKNKKINVIKLLYNILISGCDDGLINIWFIDQNNNSVNQNNNSVNQNNNSVNQINSVELSGHLGPIYDFDLTPEGELLVSGSDI